LTASGFRAIRYAQQVPNVSKIIANDLDGKVVPTITANMRENNIPDKLIEISVSDAK
jgi:tRNA (guanine26-N2/guanine27-N2)-dimethyltransferase